MLYQNLHLGNCHVEVTDEEKEDSKLQKAIDEMRRLDEILSAKISKEKETKQQRKEIQAKLWQDFLVATVFVSLSIHQHLTRPTE